VFDSSAADGLDARYELRFGDQSFAARVSEGRFDVARGTAEDPDAIIDTDPVTLVSLLWRGGSLAGALASESLRIDGSRRAVERFLRLFSLR
jgi:ubiquinone biosynthesis protein UbiJ